MARAIRGNPEHCEKHEEMGFYEGWGTVLDQLVEYVNGME